MVYKIDASIYLGISTGISLLVILSLCLGGCGAGYYLDALAGHAQLLNAQRPLDEVLADPALAEQTRVMLKTMQVARNFASQELALPDNDSYRNYADLGREYAVWNVVAAPPFSLVPKQWCFIFVGCVSYRGYYQREQAEAYVDTLQGEGLDVQVVGARAYSTLGWTDDPLLNTMLYRSEARRVGIIFHELAHQQLYIKGDSTFNESFATAVEQEGVRRWFLAQNQLADYQAYLEELARDGHFKRLLLQTRKKLQALYLKKDVDIATMRKQKAQIFSELKQAFTALKKSEPVFSAYDRWMAQDLNNAHLALVATYHEYVPAFMQLLKQQQGNLSAFYAAAKDLAHVDKGRRETAFRQQAIRWAKNAP